MKDLCLGLKVGNVLGEQKGLGLCARCVPWSKPEWWSRCGQEESLEVVWEGPAYQR